MGADEFKLKAAERALAFVEPGMRLGLGTGSTAAMFVDLLGQKVAQGFDVLCVPTSETIRAQAERLRIPLTTLDEEPFLDLTVDGTDEVDDALRLIKGGGGALLREKIVASASDRMIVIADYTKHVAVLGAFPLPLEVARFGLGATRAMIEMLAAEAGCRGDITLRQAAGRPFLTDGGNYILDCAFERIDDAETLDAALKLVPGVLESGLFLDIADLALIAGGNGVVALEAADDFDDDAP